MGLTVNHGFNLPIISILLFIIIALTYFFGWIVLGIAAGLFISITVGTAIYDKMTHNSNCSECNTIKQDLSNMLGIEKTGIKTKHEKCFDDHMYIRADIGEEKTILFDISIGGENLSIIQGKDFVAEKIKARGGSHREAEEQGASRNISVSDLDDRRFHRYMPLEKNMEPISTIEEVKHCIESFEGRPEDFKLPISDQLQDPVGLNMAIITDSILKKGWMPDGFEQKAGYRIYHYMNRE